MKKGLNYLITFVFITAAFIVFKPFIIYHLSLRAGDYVGSYLFKDAIRIYERLLFLNPDDNGAWNWLGYSYLQTGNTDKAIKTYKKAIKIDPDNVMALYDLGTIYVDSGDIVAAKGYFSKGAKASQRPGEDASTYRFYRRACSIMLEDLKNKK